MNEFKENDVTPDTDSGAQPSSENKAADNDVNIDNAENTVNTDNTVNAENASADENSETAGEDIRGVFEISGENAEKVSDFRNGIPSLMEEFPGTADNITAGGTPHRGGIFGEQRFGQEQGDQPGQPMQGGQYGQNVQPGQYGQYANGYGGQTFGQYGNGQPYGQYGGGQYGYGKSYDYPGQGVPAYGYSNGGYNSGYNTPYREPPKTPMIPAVPQGEETAVKKPSNALVITIIIVIAALLASVMILLAVNHKNSRDGEKAQSSSSGSSERLLGDRENNLSSKDNPGAGITVNISVRSKPSGDDNDYQDREKGLYTTVGVAKHISPSIVTLYGYTTTTLTPYSAATGVIISEDGFIITNAHMVEGLNRIKAVTCDGGEYEAEIIGYEPWYDLAVIRIDAAGLVPAELGSSGELEQGEQVVAIGNSGGYENTLTVGYVSYVNREIQSYSDYPIQCIQTDAAFNTGISGGALVNMYGQVVGIPTSKSVTDNDENIGFAIAMDFAVPICEEIIANGYVSWKPRVGVLYQLIDHDTADALGVPPGMRISEISEDCDISNTDLLPDDIITEMDGIPMTSDAALKEFQSIHKAGDVVTASVYRRTITGEESEFEITFRLEKSE
ncbi:MAG: trypsin-like peptidase domain-containing protein [Ruminococcus sp.]|nr:trypsin-like peptidase domain-containing protein [Ruminococcus sp.]